MSTALAAAVAYGLLLWVSYKIVGRFYILRNFPRDTAQVTAWFTLVNAVGAILAAIPIGLALTRWGVGVGKLQVLLVGLALGTYIVGGALLRYGPSSLATGWVVDSLQFLVISIAPLLVFGVLSRRSLTTRCNGRDR